MLCLKAETLGNDMFGSHGVILPMSLGSSIRRYLKRGGGKESRLSSASLSGDGSPVRTSLEEAKALDGAREKGGKMHLYRHRLEKDVQNLQKELQEEIKLHVALANAVAQTTVPLSGSPCQLPDKAQELLANIAMLEIAVLKLEEELIALHFQLSQERNERRLTEYRLRHLLSPSPSPRAYCPALSIGLCTTPPRVSKHSGSRTSHSLASYLTSECHHSQSAPNSRSSDVCFAKESLEACTAAKQEKEFDIPPLWSDRLEESKKTSLLKDLFHHPNQLSEEMVRCMRDIYLHLGDSSTPASKLSSVESMPSPVSPHGHLSFSSMASFSDSSVIPSSIRSPLAEPKHSWEAMEPSTFDPYKVPEKVNWTNIGRYSSAAEVSWMSVGEKQLKYAADALKRFRLLVEQLAKVNVASLSSNEKLAFWINLYNALIMHAYLAYGVPKSDIKLFSLMQKAAYTVGGQSFSAADIEYIVLKMKPPAHRPQIALVLALHKFKIPDEQRKYSIDNPEPLVAFALCCGMYSSPAVRIFTANNVIEELHDSLRDYVRSYVGVSNKGKLLVPKLLYCYAKGVVEDSLLTDWICRFLSPEQAAIVRDCTSHRKQRLLGARSFATIPFDSRFRYLFLLENGSSYEST